LAHLGSCITARSCSFFTFGRAKASTLLFMNDSSTASRGSCQSQSTGNPKSTRHEQRLPMLAFVFECLKSAAQRRGLLGGGYYVPKDASVVRFLTSDTGHAAI
jgi:hypothetical protein